MVDDLFFKKKRKTKKASNVDKKFDGWGSINLLFCAHAPYKNDYNE